MSALLKRMQKNSVVKKASAMHESEVFKNLDQIKLPIPIMNLAYSGELDAGIKPGMHLVAGPSRHFKSKLCLVAVKAFLDQFKDGIVLFYDSEFGSIPEYWEQDGIDTTRVLHLPVMNLEELKFDLMKKLEDIQDGEKVFIYIDSLGNLASKKEVDDALKESGAADMTRAKVGKSASRMITPYLTMKGIWLMAVQHSYDTMEMYSKKIVSGGQGWILSSHSIFIMGKRQIKDGSELTGFEFVMNTDKSRWIKEKSSIPITVTFNGGISKYSGLLDIAVETGFVIRPNNRSYVRNLKDENGNLETRLWKKSELDSDEFWNPLLENKDFKTAVKNLFKLDGEKTFTVDTEQTKKTYNIDEETGEILE